MTATSTEQRGSVHAAQEPAERLRPRSPHRHLALALCAAGDRDVALDITRRLRPWARDRLLGGS